MDKQIARIVVPAGDSASKTQGTKVFVGDKELTGITRIELVAEVNDVWRARIDCLVKPPADLKADSVTRYPTLWQRFKRWVNEPF
jgi:hypothetical protein